MSASVTRADAIRAYPELVQLAAIRDAGWTFLPQHDDAGELTALDGFRAWAGFSDALRIRSRADALGSRVVHDQLAGDGVVWELAGSVADVLGALLALPAPGASGAPDPRPHYRAAIVGPVRLLARTTGT